MAITTDASIMTNFGPRTAGTLAGCEFEGSVNGGSFAARMTPVTLTNTYINLETDAGFNIHCTPEQEFLIAPASATSVPRWVTAIELLSGDSLVISNHRNREHTTSGPEFIEGWVLGQIVGNGGHNDSKSGGTYVRFWDDDDENMREVADRFVRQLGVSGSYRGGSYNRNNKTWTIKSERLAEFANDYLKSGSKDFENALINGPTPLIAGFSRGFFDTDGSVQGSIEKGRSIRLNQSDKPKLQAVQLMLLRMGIASKIYFRTPVREKLMPDGHGDQKSYITKENWELVISRDNIQQYASKIGFFKRHKLERLSEIVSEGTREPYREKFSVKVHSAAVVHAEIAVCDCTMVSANRLIADPFTIDANGLVTRLKRWRQRSGQ